MCYSKHDQQVSQKPSKTKVVQKLTQGYIFYILGKSGKQETKNCKKIVTTICVTLNYKIKFSYITSK